MVVTASLMQSVHTFSCHVGHVTTAAVLIARVSEYISHVAAGNRTIKAVIGETKLKPVNSFRADAL